MPPPFKIGDTCILHGLKAQPSFNGQKVTLVEWMPKEGRFVLRPTEPNGTLPPVLAIKPDNLKPAGAARPDQSRKHTPGTELILQGLQAQPHFNGHRIIVTGFLFDQGRYKVRPKEANSPLPPTLAIKPENLQPLPPGSAPSGLQRTQSARGLGSESMMRGFRQNSSKELSSQSQHGSTPFNQNSQRSFSNAESTSVYTNEEETHKIGGEYELKGLRSVPHFNGHNVIIKSFLADEGRYQVNRVDPSGPLPEEFAVKPENLVPPNSSSGLSQGLAPPAADRRSDLSIKSYSQRSFVELAPPPAQETQDYLIEPGTTMEIAGLVSQPGWNGQKVIINEYLLDQGRYQVSPFNPNCQMPMVMALKPDNLRKMEGDSFHTSPIPVNIEVCQGQDDSLSLGDVSSFAGSVKSSMKTFNVGTNVFVQTSEEYPELEGHKFRVVKVLSGREYKLEPLDPEAMDACPDGEVVLHHDELTLEQLAPGTRGVIRGFNARLNGHLVKVMSYNSHRQSYLVQPLGKLAARSAGSDAVLVPEKHIEKAPTTAFWTTVSKRGKKLYVPCTVRVTQYRRGQNKVTAFISNFPGLEQVTQVGKQLLGSKKCDWSNPAEVNNALARSGSNPITCDIKDEELLNSLEEDEIVVKAHKHAATIDALVEYELVENTGRMVEVEDYGTLPVYKLVFPLDDQNTIRACDSSDASPRTVMSNEQTPRRGNKLTKAVSSRSLFSDDLDDPNEDLGRHSTRGPSRRNSNDSDLGRHSTRGSSRNLGSKSGSSRRLKSESSSRKLKRESSRRGLGRKSSHRGLSMDNEENQKADYAGHLLEEVAAKERERKKLEDELNALKASLEAQKAEAQKMLAATGKALSGETKDSTVCDEGSAASFDC